MLGKTQLFSFDRSNNNGSIDVKMDGSVLEEKWSLKRPSQKLGKLGNFFLRFLNPSFQFWL